ncbi:MAG: DHH family phosphoesterase, partial [Rhodocyclaceae bacterium]|nr:DHH family phosphoesterase [Rhodocyclaceae bacterium]
MTRLTTRSSPPRTVWQLEQQGMHPLLARLYAARGVTDKSELDYELKSLIPPTALTNASAAAQLLADAIEADASLLIIGDYDCDGATATAVGMRALKSLGANVNFLLPDRFKLGYGLSPEIVDVAAQQSPDLIITVDNGIASLEGVARANELGIATLITDHHLPAATLPAADCIVNPNQPGCDFPSKCIAGVGVMFYVMLALRAELRERGFFADHPEPNFADLLDLVALGTVADVVKLDRNNRILVSQGLKRMRAGRLQTGIAALFKAASRDPKKASAFDLGFLIGPRLNAAGRLADMRLGVECLLTDDPARALQIAQELDTLNRT